MPFIIYCSDGYAHINSSNQYCIVSEISRAYAWSTYKKASTVRKNLNKKFNRNDFYVKQVNHSDLKVKEATEQKEPVSAFDQDILDKVAEIYTIAKQAEERKIYIQQRMSNIDLEIVDIEHAAEFYNLNAAQGYKLYKMLHDARVERRKLKDEFEKINMFLGTPISSSKMESLEKSIASLDNRQYTPRVNNELFGV